MKMRLLLAALAGSALLLSQALWADDKEEKAEAEFSATCPVSGQPAGEDHFVEHQGKKVYFCCDNCPKAFAQDPEKFATKVHFQWLQTAQIVQVACPLTGRDVNPDTAVEFNGVKFCFCCEGCKGKFEGAEDQLACVFGDISKGFTLQNLCPVSDKPIDPTKFVEHEGKKVYFCCGKCPKAFTADPAKFLDKLPQFAEEEKKE